MSWYFTKYRFQVKVLYVRNLTQDITEEALKDEFERFGAVERVKKIKDYAFVHFDDRDSAVKVGLELAFRYEAPNCHTKNDSTN